MNAKRTKLIVKFLERVFSSTHSIGSVEMLSEQALRVSWSQLSVRDNASHSYSNIYAFDTEKRSIGTKLN